MNYSTWRQLTHFGFSKQAIDWARTKGVDVISLSLYVYADKEGKMAQSIRRARDQDIVLVWSTADQGNRPPPNPDGVQRNKGTRPDDLLSIAACDWNGNLLGESQKEDFDYSFVGQDVPVGVVPFLRSTESVSGSSVATALAAGTASLILACCHISENCQTNNSDVKWRFRMVVQMFNTMRLGTHPPWVDLDNFVGKGRGWSEKLHLETFINTNFILQ
jgi:subtilisin family serine protease